MKRVLIVDDVPDNLLLLGTLLRYNGWTVNEAYDGAAAFAQARRSPPDLIVSDLLMPVMDGYTLLRHCKADDRLRTIPFIVLTATYTSDQDRALAAAMGADAFLLKATPNDELVAQIEAVRNAAKADVPAPVPPGEAEAVVLREYNQVLIRKLEDKCIALEHALAHAEDNESRLRQILDVLPAAAYTCDTRGLITYCNQRAVEFWGRSPRLHDPVDRYCGSFRLFRTDGVTPVAHDECWMAIAVQTGEPMHECEIVIERADGSRRLALAHAHPLRDRSGKRVGAVNVLVDVTQRDEARAEIKASRERLSGLVNSAMDAIVSIDAEQRIVLTNPAAQTMFGYAADEMLGQPLEILLPERFRAEHRRFVDGFGRTGVTTRAMGSLGTIFGRRRSGEEFPIEASISQTVVSGAKIFTVILRDVTERQRADQIRHDSEERFRQVTETIDEVFWLADNDTNQVVYVSPAFERVWGRPVAQLYENARLWEESVHPADRARVMEQAAAMRAGCGGAMEYRIVRPDGTVRWVRDRGFPVRNAQGVVYRFAGVANDITVERQLEEQFRQAQKMEAVGQLAGGIAHDFNNLLTVIQMQGSMLLQRRDPAVAEGLRSIMDAAERAANLTRQLLTFSRRHPKESRPIDLAATVSNMVKLLRRLLGEDVVLETRFAPCLPLVNADNGMMEQVIMNLAVNARDAMPRGGQLAIGLAPVTVDDTSAAAHPLRSAGQFVRLSVRDTGSGIPPEHLARIFEPFFTTKDVGKGTGLGLATVFGIAQQHGGWVEVESKLGEGSEFHVYLPALPASADVEPAAVTPKRMPRGGRDRLLLVEDEAQVRLVARHVLERLGYTVAEAANAKEALEIVTTAPPFDLVLTDLIMPGGITGHELAQELRQRTPALRVIFMSGYSDDVVNRALTMSAGDRFLQKPFELDALANAVRNALDAP
jgi:PAS domain S-box-containing protein